MVRIAEKLSRRRERLAEDERQRASELIVEEEDEGPSTGTEISEEEDSDDAGHRNAMRRDDRSDADGEESTKKNRNTAVVMGALIEMDRRPFAEREAWTVILAISSLVNTFALGLAVDMRCHHNCEDDKYLVMWRMVDHVFTALPIAEVVVTMVSLGPRKYLFLDKKRRRPFHVVWKRFSINQKIQRPPRFAKIRCADIILISLRCIAVWGLGSNAPQALLMKHLSALRVYHVSVLVSRSQGAGKFRELAMIMNGMQDTMRVVCVVAVVLALVMWVFGIAFTIIAGERVPSSEFDYEARRVPWDKNSYWGTVPNSVFSLLQVVTTDQWSNHLVRSLVEYEVGVGILIAVFIVITSLALMSTIVGVIVESILQAARDNHEKRDRQERKMEDQVMLSMQTLFVEADEADAAEADGDGSPTSPGSPANCGGPKPDELTRSALVSALKQTNIRRRLGVVDIRPSDLELLFHLLDDECEGHLDPTMFFRACLRLRGEASARDLNNMGIDMKRYCSWLDEADGNVGQVNDTLSGLLDVLYVVDRDIVQDPGTDAKDPVLMARRARTYVPKGNSLRKSRESRHTVALDFGADKPGSGLSAQQRRSASNLSLGTAAPRKSKVSEVPEAPQGSALSKRKPPPPPIPVHLKHQFDKRGRPKKDGPGRPPRKVHIKS